MSHNPQTDEQTTARMESMRASGATRLEIAAALGMSISKVKRWIAKFDIAPRPRKNAEENAARVVAHNERPRYANPEEGETLLEKAKTVLGRRLGEDHRGYLLDGRPSNTAAILKAAGLRLKNEPHSPPSHASVSLTS